MLPLEEAREFSSAHAESFFENLPPAPAVCLIELRESHSEPLLIRTQNLRRRLQRLLGPPDSTSKRLNLREVAREVKYRATGSPFEQSLTYYHHAKRIFPNRYRDLMRMRPPAVLKVSVKSAYPRCYVTRHVSADDPAMPRGAGCYGPFPSRRAAAAFAERSLDFFKVRRCHIKIRRDPSFPGCIYSEMKMCLAPCFAGCSNEEYDVEVRRFVEFLESAGESLHEAYERERERASEDLDFERAATMHKKIEKLEEVLRAKPDLVRRIGALDAVILQRSTEQQTVSLFRLLGGRLSEPFFLKFGEMASQPRSAEHVVRGYLDPDSIPQDANALGETAPAQVAANHPQLSAAENKSELSEHLWLLARWYYSNPREGEIFFRQKDWPYRRLLRACSRLLAPRASPAAE